MTAACIGWSADPPCPVHGVFHGCAHPDGHGQVKGGHVCACGAATRMPQGNGLGQGNGSVIQGCGTNAGYYRHIRRREQACPSCLAAHRAYVADYAARRRAARAAT